MAKKSRTTVMVEKKTLKEFKKRAIDEDAKLSELMEKVMKEYLKKKS